MRYEVDVIHYLSIYKKEWKKIVSLVSVAIFITAVAGFLQPTVYRSVVTILSPKEGGQGGVVGRYLGLFNSAAGSSDYAIFSMLKSVRMRKDVNEYFNLKDKRNFWWTLNTFELMGGFGIEVKGPDPEMTEKIANFTTENLDKINAELQITPQRPMVKVLDAATRGTALSKNILKKVIAVGLFVFMVYCLFLFFREYLGQLKAAGKRPGK